METEKNGKVESFQPFNFLLVGNLTLDIKKIETHQKILHFESIGGPPAFQTYYLSRRHHNIWIYGHVPNTVEVAARKILKNEHVNLKFLKVSNYGPTFSHHYPMDVQLERTSTILKEGEKIELSDTDLHYLKALQLQKTIVSPVFQEVSVNTLQKLRQISSFLTIDIQGYLRTVNPSNRQLEIGRLYSWDIFTYSDLIKFSLDEIQHLQEKLDAPSWLSLSRALSEVFNLNISVTAGAKGSYLFPNIKSKNHYFYTPAFTDIKIIDQTGAGDVYLAALTEAFPEKNKNNKTFLSAITFASAVASCLIEKEGIYGNYEHTRIVYRQQKLLKAAQILVINKEEQKNVQKVVNVLKLM